MQQLRNTELYLGKVDGAIQVSSEDGWDDEDDEEVALDKKGEVKYHEAIAKH